MQKKNSILIITQQNPNYKEIRWKIQTQIKILNNKQYASTNEGFWITLKKEEKNFFFFVIQLRNS